MTDTRISLTKQLYNKRFEICQKDIELRKWLHIQFGLDIDAADRWDDLTKQHVINQIDALIAEPKLGARKTTINFLGSQWVEQQLTAKRMATRTEIDDIWAARRRELTRYFCGCRTSGLSQLTATEGEQFIKWLEYRIKPEGDEPAPAPWVPDPLPITDAVTRTPLIQIPTLMALEASSVQVVALLPAITDTPLVYGCDQFIQVPIDIDAAPAFAGQDNRTQWLAVRVVEVEPETVYTCREPKVERLPVLEDYAANKLLPVRARQSAFMFQNEVLNSRWMGAATERHGNLWDMTITQFNAFWQDFVFNAPAYLVEPILDNLLSKYAWREDKEWHAIQREEWTKKHRQPSPPAKSSARRVVRSVDAKHARQQLGDDSERRLAS